ncbi:DNA-binding protein WhiA [Arthrobacter bambusae]|uniref:DNA-binding protein WhiA n=1 Tax=Arthrobacter bambusae TaxID=1338426 RepID=UPI0027D8B23A|nr:DNA-binding protein WhiA [Arthrobacter bambusae]
MTVSVKEELSEVEIRNASARKAEVSTILRFAGGLHVLSGRLMVQAEVDLVSTARRVRAAIADLYGHRSEILRLPTGRVQPGGRYVLRIGPGSEVLARQTGLLDSRGNPVRGLPPAIVNGSSSDAEAVWRGAFLAQGSLTEPGRPSLLEVICPGPEAALALVGAARRLGIGVTSREVRGVDRVTIRDRDSIVALLSRMGASASLAKWQDQRRANDLETAPANRSVNFDVSNLRRSAQAALDVSARVERALEILGDDVPQSLKHAGELRLAHRQASLYELGRLADPPLNKDTIAGRIRRLLVTAEKHALNQGTP